MPFFSSKKSSSSNFLRKIWQEASEQTRKGKSDSVKPSTSEPAPTVVTASTSAKKTAPVNTEYLSPGDVSQSEVHSELGKVWKEASERESHFNQLYAKSQQEEELSHKLVANVFKEALATNQQTAETPSIFSAVHHSNLATIWKEASSNSVSVHHSNLTTIAKEASVNKPLATDNLTSIVKDISATANKTPPNDHLTSIFKEVSQHHTDLAKISYDSEGDADDSFSTNYINTHSAQHVSEYLKADGSNDVITVNGITGVWVNKEECLNWRGPIPIEHYKINQDANPTIIRKKRMVDVDATQRICVKFLKPPALPVAGDLIIREEAQHLPPAPPIIIRQELEAPKSPGPIIIREKPPRPPATVPVQTITIPGEKILDPPPRQVIIERVPTASTTPQEVIVERWLSYPPQKRNIVYEKSAHSHESITYKSQPNVIIDWEATSHLVEENQTHRSPHSVFVDWENTDQDIDVSAISGNYNKQVTFLGVETADPIVYANIHSNELIDSHKMPRLVNEFKAPHDEMFASNLGPNEYILTGDVDALALVNREELDKYLLTKF